MPPCLATPWFRRSPRVGVRCWRLGSWSASEHATQAAAQAAPQAALQAIAGAYLSRHHVENVEEGCLIAALASEIPRQVPEVRSAATRVVEQMIDLVARHANGAGEPGAYEQALATVATMVGALVLARTVEDPALADALLKAALTRLPHAES